MNEQGQTIIELAMLLFLAALLTLGLVLLINAITMRQDLLNLIQLLQ